MTMLRYIIDSSACDDFNWEYFFKFILEWKAQLVMQFSCHQDFFHRFTLIYVKSCP